MQIFVCQGEIKINGFQNYEDISHRNSSNIDLPIMKKHGHSCH
jgi:hypothetical protein